MADLLRAHPSGTLQGSSGSPRCRKNDLYPACQYEYEPIRHRRTYFIRVLKCEFIRNLTGDKHYDHTRLRRFVVVVVPVVVRIVLLAVVLLVVVLVVLLVLVGCVRQECVCMCVYVCVYVRESVCVCAYVDTILCVCVVFRAP